MKNAETATPEAEFKNHFVPDAARKLVRPGSSWVDGPGRTSGPIRVYPHLLVAKPVDVRLWIVRRCTDE